MSIAGNKTSTQRSFATGDLHPAWLAFIRHCQELGFGEISNLKIQDGVPVMAEECIKKTKFC
jgi:hypothetical protein